MSELVTNALLHGVPPGRGFRIHLYLDPADGVLRVEAHDSGDGEVRLADAGAAPDEEGRRGLLLVAALADTWGVEERHPGKVCGVSSQCGAGRPRVPGRTAPLTETHFWEVRFRRFRDAPRRRRSLCRRSARLAGHGGWVVPGRADLHAVSAEPGTEVHANGRRPALRVGRSGGGFRRPAV